MSATQLKTIKQITGEIVVETGLHVGGSQETMEISGLDNPVIRHPANAEPFVPGSSLKGKMRSLAEWARGEVPPNGDVTKPRVDGETARVFGLPARNEQQARKLNEDPAPYHRGPSRLIVRDARLTDSSRDRFKAGHPITEIKHENSINRLTSVANPRPMERVLPEVRFDLQLVYRVFDVNGDGGQEDERLFTDVLLHALALVEADALGGGSSRGNGKIRFEDGEGNPGIKVNDQATALPGLSPTDSRAASA
jgi:CRISPR-associated protein Csm3